MADVKTMKLPPRATGSEPAHPYREPVDYLISKGWKPTGDPFFPATLWIDPTKPEKETSSRIKVLERINPRTKEREEIFQTHISPAAWPMRREEAVWIQWQRDQEDKAKAS